VEWSLVPQATTKQMFSHAIVRPPGRNFADGLTTFKGGPPDYKKALAQHDAYCAALKHCGLELLRLASDLAYPDSTFVEDVAIVTDRFAILTRPGAETRLGEVAGIREPLKQFFREIHEISAPGTLDGGDVCQAGSRFFIGISQRTNEQGAKQLAAFLAQCGYASSLIDIRSLKGILHLKSGLASLSDDLLVAIEELAALPELSGYQIVRVSPEESYAANCIHVNGHVLLPTGFSQLTRELAKHGFEPLEIDVSEFRKMDGGLSCLSLRF
jgi:dimethylargininase